jgi:UDP-N-acetyl-D-glucosamine dehydrogenase
MSQRLAYKADVDDIRELPSFVPFNNLYSLGCELSYYDPYVPVIGATREHANWQGIKSVAWEEKTIRCFAAAVIVTAHRAVNYCQLTAWCECVVDTRNVIAGSQKGVWRA